MTLSILIGEDNLFTLKQYEKILEKNGHNVTVTKDGEECVKKYSETLKNEKKSSPFDVVLIDNNMPKKSGAEAAKEILEKQPNQRIIFASAYDIDSLLNAKDFIKKSVEIIQKPFSLNSLVAKIQNRK